MLLFYLFIYLKKNLSLDISSKCRFLIFTSIYLIIIILFIYFKIPLLNNSSKFRFTNFISKIPILKFNFQDSNFQIILKTSIFKNPIFFRTILISFWFSNNLIFLLILYKHECHFHNFRIMEFVRLIRTRSIGLWWEAPHT